ncbi:MAG: hypothetical protein ABII12_03595 [Planctomycetota bacterium]
MGKTKPCKITLEWMENGTLKQRTADVLLYQLPDGRWGVFEGSIRFVLAKEGGSNVLKAFLAAQPCRDRWEERRITRGRRLRYVGMLVVGLGLGVLL